VNVSVCDSGIGIAPVNTAIIFEEFRQVGDTTRGVKEGTGLGLAIASRLLEQQGGSIKVESTVGEGSTFTFCMPAAELAAAAPGPALIPGLSFGNELSQAPTPSAAELDEDGVELPTPLVLVVDDDPAVVELQTHYLHSGGFAVEPASNGTEGVAKAKDLAPDVITLDIMMPSQNGWETLHAMKNDPATANIPVVIVSVVEQRQLAIKLGAADCLVKPVTRADLLAVVRKLTPRHEGAPTILVVDNDALSAELSSAVLQAIGARPIWMSSGEEALRMIQRCRPDAMLLDLLMPGMDGFEVLGVIRDDPKLADLPVYVLTGKDLTEGELKFLSARTQLILRKTGNWREELQARVSVVIRKNAAAKRTA